MATAACVALGAFGVAEAAPCGTNLDTENVGISSIGGVGVSTIYATTCHGPVAGNDMQFGGGEGEDTLNSGIFGGYDIDLASGWSNFGASNTTAAISFAATPDDPNKGGTWSVDFTPDAFSVFAVVLKGATNYALYLFDLRPDADSMFGGDYKMNGILVPGPSGNIAGLSHLSIYTWGDPSTPPPAVIPLPAAGWLLLGGLGVLGAVRRRRKAA